jgi:hypothetical protein
MEEMEENPKTEEEVIDLIDNLRDGDPTLDLTNLNITDLQLTEMEFYNVNFSNSILPRFHINEVIMYDINLSGTNLINSVMINSELHHVFLRGSNLTSAVISHTKIYKTDFRGTNLTDTVFTSSTIKDSTFENVIITPGIIFDKVTMDKVNLQRATLLSAKMAFSNILNKTDFTSAILIDADFTESIIEESTLFENARMMGVILTRVVMKNVNLSGINLSGAKMMGADLSGVDFSGSDLYGADLTDAIVKGTIFNKTTIRHTIFNGVKLFEAKILSEVDLTTANLTGAIMTDDSPKIAKKSSRRKTLTINKNPTTSRTEKMIDFYKLQKMRSTSQSSKKEKCINILIMAHGLMDQSKMVNDSLFDNVKISLMGGGIGMYGLMGVTEVKNIQIQDIDDKNKVYNLTGRRTYNETVLQLISKVFPSLLNRHNNYVTNGECNEEFLNIFNHIVTYVKIFFNSIGRKYFPKQDEFVKGKPIQQRRNSFIDYYGLNEKMFQFFPNPYEYCVNPALREKCVLNDLNKRQLSYGLHILQSSDPIDLPYSLAGIISIPGESYNSSNLNYWYNKPVKEGQRDSVKVYWRKKLEKNIQHLIPRISTKLMNIYDRLSVGLNPHGLYNKNPGKLVSLSEIITLFKIGFGFTSVNILDFSCNECIGKLPSDVSRAITDEMGSNSYLKKWREAKKYFTQEEWKKIDNPSFQDIVNVDAVGKATSDEKPRRRTKTKRLTFGGSKTKKRRRKFRKM